MISPASLKPRTQDRRAQLVQAALLLAARSSPSDITTAELARVVGLTQGAVFKHFDSKEDIWLAVVDWTHHTLMQDLKTVAAGNAGCGQALQALRAVFMAHIDFVQRYPGAPRLIFQELQHARATPLKTRVQALLADYRQLLAQLLEQARSERSVAFGLDTGAAAILFIGAIQGLVMQSLISGSLARLHEQAQPVFDLYSSGLQQCSPTLSRSTS